MVNASVLRVGAQCGPKTSLKAATLTTGQRYRVEREGWVAWPYSAEAPATGLDGQRHSDDKETLLDAGDELMIDVSTVCDQNEVSYGTEGSAGVDGNFRETYPDCNDIRRPVKVRLYAHARSGRRPGERGRHSGILYVFVSKFRPLNDKC